MGEMSWCGVMVPEDSISSEPHTPTIENSVPRNSTLAQIRLPEPIGRLSPRIPAPAITNVVYASGTASVTLGYDALNRLTNMVDGIGTTMQARHAG